MMEMHGCQEKIVDKGEKGKYCKMWTSDVTTNRKTNSWAFLMEMYVANVLLHVVM